MKIVFLAREGIAANYIASVLSEKFEFRMIVESGNPARRRKLRRYFPIAKPWTWPVRVLDILAAMLYNRQIGQALVAGLSGQIHNRAAPKFDLHFCEDANDSSVRSLLEEWRPDVVLVYGTAILKKPVLSLCSTFLNVHGGIVPAYRNVHSEFWALSRNDRQSVGTSILYLDTGIDSGNIALQRKLELENTSSVQAAIIANTKLSAILAIEALDLFQHGQLPRISQSDLSPIPGRTNTPGFRELILARLFGKPKI